MVERQVKVLIKNLAIFFLFPIKEFLPISRSLSLVAIIPPPHRVYSTWQCQTNVLSGSKAFVLLLSFQKRSNIFVLETKFWIETKRFLSVLKKFCPKAFVLFRFQTFFETVKSFVLS
jgi:hypothetical protein